MAYGRERTKDARRPTDCRFLSKQPTIDNREFSEGKGPGFLSTRPFKTT